MIIEGDGSSNHCRDKKNEEGGDSKKQGKSEVEGGALNDGVEMEVKEIHNDGEENIEVVVQKMIDNIEKKETDVVEDDVVVIINGVEKDKRVENNWSMEEEIMERGLLDFELEGVGSGWGKDAKLEGKSINNEKIGEWLGREHERGKILHEYTCSYPFNWEVLDGGCEFWGVSEHEVLSHDWEVSLWNF